MQLRSIISLEVIFVAVVFVSSEITRNEENYYLQGSGHAFKGAPKNDFSKRDGVGPLSDSSDYQQALWESYYEAYPDQSTSVASSSTVPRQDFGAPANELALVAAIPGIFAVLGLIAVAIGQANNNDNQQSDIDDLKTRLTTTETDQTSICTAIRMVGNINVGQSTTPSAAEVNALINAVNGINTPTCT